MDRKERLQQIKDMASAPTDTGMFRAGDVTAEIHGQPKADSFDITKFLLEEISHLETLNKHLVQQHQELIAEMENVKADFGGDQR